VLAPSQDTAFELGLRAGLVAVPRRARGVAPLVYGGVTLGVALDL
jgi:hypothetical protein